MDPRGLREQGNKLGIKESKAENKGTTCLFDILAGKQGILKSRNYFSGKAIEHKETFVGSKGTRTS